MHKIYPCLWFDHEAADAAAYYCSIFSDSKIGKSNPMVSTWDIHNQHFMGLNGGPQYKMNSSISIFASFEHESELEEKYNALINGGSVLMPLASYPWSAKYAWIKDKYGLNWQLMTMKGQYSPVMLWPSLLFANTQYGNAKKALDFYTSVFSKHQIFTTQFYDEKDTPPGQKPGAVKYAQFTLNDSLLSLMDGPGDHNFDFNEGISLVIHCDTQDEIDYYWAALISDNGSESMCGWLKDPFGVSWQVVPTILGDLMTDSAKAPKVGAALLKMRKLDINHLIIAANDHVNDNPKTVITIKAEIDASIEKVWKSWTDPESIMQWNYAMPEWHCPAASHELKVGGNFSYTMAARDGSLSFDFQGTFDEIVEMSLIKYTIADGRKVTVKFESKGKLTLVTEDFEAENLHSEELQQAGWQAILDNFRKYVENKGQ